MPTRNVNLTDHYDEFVADQIQSGKYRDVSEVMRAGLRLLEQQTEEEQHKLGLLRKLASKGFDELDQGKGIKLCGTEAVNDYISRIGRRAAAARRRKRA